jgi:hypothetical protein
MTEKQKKEIKNSTQLPSPFPIEGTHEKIKKANILRKRGERRSDQAIAYPYNASDAKGES